MADIKVETTFGLNIEYRENGNTVSVGCGGDDWTLASLADYMVSHKFGGANDDTEYVSATVWERVWVDNVADHDNDVGTYPMVKEGDHYRIDILHEEVKK